MEKRPHLRIYVSHPSGYDFKELLYGPLKKIEGVTFVFPHERTLRPAGKSLETIKKCGLILAEVSLPSHGVGIELGWAHCAGVPVVLLYKQRSKISASLNLISREKVEYKDVNDLREKVGRLLKSKKYGHKKKR